MSLAKIPYEILLCVLDNISSEVDRQCLRLTCRRLYNIIEPYYLTGRQLLDFLNRHIKDLSPLEQKLSMVCSGCVRITRADKYKGNYRKCSRCGHWRAAFMRWSWKVPINVPGPRKMEWFWEGSRW